MGWEEDPCGWALNEGWVDGGSCACWEHSKCRERSVGPWVSEICRSWVSLLLLLVGQMVKSASDRLQEEVGLTFLHVGSPRT